MDVLTASIPVGLLIVSDHCHSHENSFCHWKEIGLFHLLLTSHCSDSFLLANISCLCTPSSQYTNRAKQSSLLFTPFSLPW
ncbi:hypothetical protein Nmel_013344 [Mimus melanotis]